MEKTEVNVLRVDEQKIKGKLVLKKGNIYMLKNEKLRLEVIQLHYNMLLARYKEKKIEDVKVSNKKLLVVRSDKGYREICKRM